MPRFARFLGAAVLLLLVVVPAAHAQLVGLKHVWTVPGAMNTAAGLATYIACTNASTATQTIGIDIYGSGGAYIPPIGSNSISVAADGTVVFGTTSAAGISVDVVYGSGVFTRGQARIFASAGKGVLCSAFLADGGSPIPTSMANLTVAKKFSQKGD